MLLILDGAQKRSFCAANCITYETINAKGMPTNAGKWLIKYNPTSMITNGQKNMAREMNHLVSLTPGIGNCFGLPSVSKPACDNAIRHWRLVFISSAVTAGVLPSLFLAKRSAPYSSSFCIDSFDPFTSAQCRPVKPWSSVA